LQSIFAGPEPETKIGYKSVVLDPPVLLQRQGEYYLKPESLAMNSWLPAKKSIQSDENKGG
jgi:hypothetical protein